MLSCYIVAMHGRSIIVALMLCGCSMSQDRPASPPLTKFVIARHTFIDVGPPNDFYELLFVRQSENGSLVEKVTLTPPTDQCFIPAKVAVADGTVKESIQELLGKTDPCAITEKELRRERKRCKNCLVFSGANVSMQISCGSRTRVIRSDILDRDMFDPAPNTPEHTSWTMHMLDQIDRNLGPGVFDRPLFPIVDSDKKDISVKSSENLNDVASGKYDELFKDAPDRPSDLYRAAQVPPTIPTVHLLSITPVQPETFSPPGYPPLAKLARVQGTVTITGKIGEDGGVRDFFVDSGHPMLRPAVQDAVSHWKFPAADAGQTFHAAMQFATNCPAKKTN